MIDGLPQVMGACQAALDRAFHYGDGLFETIPVIQGKPLFWNEHLHRLQSGAAMLHMAAPRPEQWREDLRKLQEEMAGSERYVLKLVLSRGSGWGYGIPRHSPPCRYLFATDWPQRSADHWQPGILTDICSVPLLTGAPYLQAKTLNRLNQIMARNALPAAYAEGILLDQHGFLREGIMSNIFWVSAGMVHTPSLETGGIAGIQRNAILNCLQEWGISSVMGDYLAESLDAADEIFFSNSLIGIWPVKQFQGRRLPGDRGEISARILAWQSALGLGYW
ncbi:aminodeoxychorismate lyase [Acidithiobacillus sp. M4-SHS-6]|uniref:aminodeoxychorismate lyase n=1 Tax=Acidithiobacillus sp. M4-SHS-6 TaxID=3383024 RepID=UPI0039BDA72B